MSRYQQIWAGLRGTETQCSVCGVGGREGGCPVQTAHRRSDHIGDCPSPHPCHLPYPCLHPNPASLTRICSQTCLDPEEDVAVKGVYALAAMVRNQQQMHQAFVDAGEGSAGGGGGRGSPSCWLQQGA